VEIGAKNQEKNELGIGTGLQSGTERFPLLVCRTSTWNSQDGRRPGRPAV